MAIALSKLTWAVIAGAGLWLGARGLVAQVPPEERTPIMDPDRLQALGFPRDVLAKALGLVAVIAHRRPPWPGSLKAFEMP